MIDLKENVAERIVIEFSGDKDAFIDTLKSMAYMLSRQETDPDSSHLTRYCNLMTDMYNQL